MYIYGTESHARVVREIAEAAGSSVKAVVGEGCDVPAAVKGQPAVVAVPDNAARRRTVEQLHGPFATVVHPSAVVAPSARIGEGTVVMPGAIVNADAVVGRHCIIDTGASVDHECHVSDFCHIGPHATLCGAVQVGSGTLVGAAACVIPCIHIGRDCTIGAGAAVIKNIADNMKEVGVPAKPLVAAEKAACGGVN